MKLLLVFSSVFFFSEGGITRGVLFIAAMRPTGVCNT